jgi:hypothetical protein
MANPIFVCAVTPSLVTSLTISTKVFSQPTAMAFAAQPFMFWRGDIKFKFEIVCSSFHRGKFAIFFEPNIYQYTLIAANLSLNKQFFRIIDIQETQTVEFVVNWASYRAWNRTTSATASYINQSNLTSTSIGDGFVNGFVGVVPFTALQSPDASGIYVNVYVSCENLQVNGLAQDNLFIERLAVTESNVWNYKSSEGTQPVTTFDLNESTATTTHICESHFGEQPLTFRALLKRYVTVDMPTVSASVTTAPRVLSLTAQIYPKQYWVYGATGNNFPNLFNYLYYAYVGIRGGIRYRIHPNIPTGTTLYGHGKFSIATFSSSTTDAAVSYSSAFSAAQAPLRGAVTYVPATNAGFEAELPFYSNNLFALGFALNRIGGTTTDNMCGSWFKQFKFDLDIIGATTDTCAMVMEAAAAEDFSFMRYQGAPFYSGNPVA